MSFMVWCLDSSTAGVEAITGSSLLEARCAIFLIFSPPLEIMVEGGTLASTGVCSVPLSTLSFMEERRLEASLRMNLKQTKDKFEIDFNGIEICDGVELRKPLQYVLGCSNTGTTLPNLR